MPSPEPLPIDWVTDDASLKSCCARWQQCEQLAVDTEFERSRTFHARLCLVQIEDGTGITLIDPFGIQDLTPLLDLFCQPAPVTVFHSCGEDIDLLGTLANRPLLGLYDTQIAAGLCGHSSVLSYQNMVAELLDIEVDKGQTRSDWTRRPLSDAQIRYAALDVLHLPPMKQLLDDELARRGRQSWADEEFDRLSEPVSMALLIENQFARFNSAWKLDRRSQHLLVELLTWREALARERNLPRTWVVKDAVLYQLAERQPVEESDLDALDGLTDKDLRRHGRDWLSLSESVAGLDEAALREALPRPLDGAQRQTLKALRQCVDAVAEHAEVDSGLICNKRDLTAVVRAGRLCGRLASGWRHDLLAEAVAALPLPPVQESS